MSDMNLCICCDATTHDHTAHDQFLNKPLCVCGNCGHIQLKIIPTQQVITAYYRSNYSDNRSLNLGPAYERLMFKRASAQVKYIQRFISLDNAGIADIGCGFGHFLRIANSLTANVKGYEFDLRAVTYCNSENISVDLLKTEDQLRNLSFADVYVLSHVLEHFLDPAGTLRSLGKNCKYIFIELPLYQSGIKEQFIDLEGHINLFNLHSLRCFLNKNGFDIIDLTPCGPGIKFFYLKRWNALRKLLQIATGDLFINQYCVSRSSGLWARALIRYGG